MHTHFSCQELPHTRTNPLSEPLSRRTGEPRAARRPDGDTCLFNLTVRCASDDADAVDTVVRETLGENLQAQKRKRLGKAWGTHLCGLELIVSCQNSSRRSVMALMSGLEHEALVRSVVWEIVPNAARTREPMRSVSDRRQD
jgi:hypothetical protein